MIEGVKFTNQPINDLISVYKSSAPPFPTALQACPYNSSLKKVIGKDVAYKKIFGAIENGRTEWFSSKLEVTKIAEAVIEAISKDPKVVDRSQAKFESLARELLKILDREKLEKELPELGMSDILATFKNAIKLYQETVYWSDPANFALEVKGHEIVQERLRGSLKRQELEFRESEFLELFATLSNSTKISFITEAETDLLKIALIDEMEAKKKSIKQFAQKYYWLRYDYYGPILDEKTVTDELQTYKGMNRDTLEKRIIQNQALEVASSTRLKQALSKIVLDRKLSDIFSSLRKFAYFYGDIKKRDISKANVGLGLIVREISRRTGIDETDLHYATVTEIESLMSGSEVLEQTLKDRRKKSLFEVSTGVYKFISGSLPGMDTDTKQSNLIKGMSACSGFYVGRARIIRNPRNCVFNQGEILITEMTSVDFVPLMKKAGAIITDRGGITSHAAIVSRELDVPCVIGTGNATQAVRDGDIVQVNARHGIVKILKRENKK